MSDAIVDNGRVFACVFCGGVFATPPATSEKIHCDPAVGGCGGVFKIVTFPTSAAGSGGGGGGNGEQA